jgi:diguanylate cyclase (GGDEF)-like protein/PAS domain S-box-containing protein
MWWGPCSSGALQVNRRSVGSALEVGATVIFEVDLLTRTMVVSENFEGLLGLSSGTFSGHYSDFLHVVHPADRAKLDLRTVRSAEAGTPLQTDFRVVLPTGAERRFHARYSVVTDAEGRSTTVLGVAIDVTDQHEADEARRFFLDTTVDAFVGMDRDGLVTEWNVAAERLFGIPRQAAMGRPTAALVIPVRYRGAHLVAIGRILANLTTPSNGPARAGAKGPVELSAMRSDGSEVPVEVTVHTVPTSGGVVFKAFIRDISERKELEAALSRQALADSLTGLPNRALLADRLAVSLARMAVTRAPVAVLFIGVDRFKVVNDTLGHGAGDQLLQQLSERFKAVIRPTDTLARFGGDSFVVLRENTNEVEAVRVAQHLMDVLRPSVVLDDREVSVSVSIGVAVTDDSARPTDELLGDADAAMFLAKQRGRGRTEFFDRAMRSEAMARFNLEAELRQGLEREELRVWFQPVISISTGQISGVEALVRWAHPTRGLVPPAEFIPIAEDSGLIVPLGVQVLHGACQQVASWRAAGADLTDRSPLADLTVAVNLSARQLVEPGIAELVAQILAESALDPGALCLEITESVNREDTDAAAAALQRLHALGVRLAVDDFGTGYSSLLYLRHFPVQTLKLDRSFVHGIGRNPADTSIVRATIELAHALELDAVAEGVEREDQLHALRDMECDLGQGFLWAPPLPAVEMIDFLRSPPDLGFFAGK